ncbi:condensin subunit ScpA [Stella humosa]|uniref:Segregation and condensation protein A n=1 Tax=Stella humosa TaxID=94 RepID=A0A3N1MA16_9PROT|nr:ScpA family protein [Stella humosa]ROP99884.1 condensin subunit ScpA [Stella humosa]BBK30886.1 segregation/condensation protein A [Stella humosa]
MAKAEPFEEDRPTTAAEGALVVDLEGFEGPIDVLLSLARDQKVDLTRISILALADQYLAFVTAAKALRLELAAEYLVMAAWLAYLKSRLLLPEPETDDEPSGQDLAEALAFQLLRLEAMQKVGATLFAGSQLGRDVFARGEPEGVRNVTRGVYELSLFELLKAYAEHRRQRDGAVLHIDRLELYSMDEALQRLSRLVGRTPGWSTLASYLPDDLRPGIITRAAMAAMFAASLELAREGRVVLRQDQVFGPIFVRSGKPANPDGGAATGQGQEAEQT